MDAAAIKAKNALSHRDDDLSQRKQILDSAQDRAMLDPCLTTHRNIKTNDLDKTKRSTTSAKAETAEA